MATPSIMVSAPLISADLNNAYNQLVVSNGASITGGSTFDTISGGRGTITVTNGSTLAVTGLRVLYGTVTAGATATNVTLATGIQGQELTVINGNATGASTIIITGNVVTAAAASITISGLSAARLIFDSTVGSWIRCI